MGALTHIPEGQFPNHFAMCVSEPSLLKNQHITLTRDYLTPTEIDK